MSEEIAHEAVVSSLLDLQARLRGDLREEDAAQIAVDADDTSELVRVPEAMPIFVNLPDGSIPAPTSDALTVIEDDLIVEVTTDDDRRLDAPSDEEGYFAPVTALHPVATVPDDARLAALTERLSRLETELDGVIGRIDKVDPERIERLESVHAELGVQHEGLKAKIDSHFTDLQHSIDRRLGGTEG